IVSEWHYDQHAMLLESETVRKVHKTRDISVLLDVPAGAVVQGLALGGGLEVPMGCNACIAAPKTQLGLPESYLDFMPGFGCMDTF
ncbi:peroxisomal fatty acid beta-oxidation multifunctional protein AIM1, partial [Tanacetum coccineum]